MARIITLNTQEDTMNNREILLSGDAEDALNKAAANVGLDTVYVKKYSNNENEANLFKIYADEDLTSYLFLLDTESDNGAVISA